jgi:hypothetical protein
VGGKINVGIATSANYWYAVRLRSPKLFQSLQIRELLGNIVEKFKEISEKLI